MFARRPALALILAAGCSSRPTAAGFVVQRANGAVTVRAPDGRVLLDIRSAATRNATALWQELFGQFRVTEGAQPWTDGPVEEVLRLDASTPAEGALLLDFRSRDAGANRIALSIACAEGDRFLGFGEQSDALDHRGHRIPIWTSEPGIGKYDSDDSGDLWFLVGTRHGSSLGLPTWLSNRGYIGAVETDRRAVFDVCKASADVFRVEAWSDSVKLWIYDGPAPAQALERATSGVLGRQMRPPAVAFAPWNDAIRGSQSVRDVAATLRLQEVPSSVIWTEDFRGGAMVGDVDYQITDEWELDRRLYPDAEKVAADLHGLGFLWLAYFNAFVAQGTAPWDSAQPMLVRNAGGKPYPIQAPTLLTAGLVDLWNPAARGWAKAYMQKALDLGFDGWMADYGEWLPHDAIVASGEDGLAAHQRYAAEWVRLNAELPALVFSRSGWMGSQRFVQVHWPGDQRTDFEPDDGLPTVVPLAVSLGLAGWSTTGADIAGYQSATNAPASKELFFRWTELGALQPVMRTHHGRSALANWRFDADTETLLHWKRWATLHARLLPYLDGLARQHEEHGLPMMRALALEFPDDAAGWPVFDEYLLGPFLLVAPVQVQGALSRRVHFPPGTWIPFAGGDPVQGPADLDVAAPLAELPLYACAGAVIPLFTTAPQSVPRDLAQSDKARTLLVFQGADGSFTERDGTSYAQVKGKLEIRSARQVTVELH